MEIIRAGSERLPLIIQGGMGVGVSNWRLARTVAEHGHLGVVSGTALGTVLARRLQDGDAGGDVRRALAHCPLQAASDRIQTRYLRPSGRMPGQPYQLTPLHSIAPADNLVELTIVANFVEVWLAKENHTGIVGLNLL